MAGSSIMNWMTVHWSINDEHFLHRRHIHIANRLHRTKMGPWEWSGLLKWCGDISFSRCDGCRPLRTSLPTMAFALKCKKMSRKPLTALRLIRAMLKMAGVNFRPLAPVQILHGSTGTGSSTAPWNLLRPLMNNPLSRTQHPVWCAPAGSS